VVSGSPVSVERVRAVVGRKAPQTQHFDADLADSGHGRGSDCPACVSLRDQTQPEASKVRAAPAMILSTALEQSQRRVIRSGQPLDCAEPALLRRD